MSGSARVSPYAWLPRGAREWSPPYGGAPSAWPRFTAAYALLVLLRVTADVPVPWLLAAAALVAAASAAAYRLRRVCARPRGGGWVVAGAGTVALVAPGGSGGPRGSGATDGTGGPAVRATVAARGGRVLGGAEAADALRGAAELLRAAERDPAALAAVGAGPEEDGGARYVVHDGRSAFVLRARAPRPPGVGAPGRAARDRGARQRQLLADVAGELGAEAPPDPADGAGRPGEVPAAGSPAGRAAAALAAAAAAAAGSPLPDTDPDVRGLPWPPHRAAAAAADGALRLATFAAPVALWAAWLAGAWS
ncbi:hypothetical protein [Streptomyces sp. MAR4 CNX-425]|uniref:hypothetical protein n=1 Tax=Streptomyces sp. MAR4 CNX-425 TaxID=3406343 RepID=UPI003B5094CA